MRFGFGDSQVSTDLLHRHWTASHRATIDVSQPLIQDNSAQYYTTVTQKIDTDHCAKLVGICCDYAHREQARPILIRSGTAGLISRPFFLTNLLRALRRGRRGQPDSEWNALFMCGGSPAERRNSP